MLLGEHELAVVVGLLEEIVLDPGAYAARSTAVVEEGGGSRELECETDLEGAAGVVALFPHRHALEVLVEVADALHHLPADGEVAAGDVVGLAVPVIVVTALEAQ